MSPKQGFWSFMKNLLVEFFRFFNGITVSLRLEINWNEFSGRLNFGLLCQTGRRWTENLFFQVKRSMHWFFIFCMKLEKHNGWKLGKIILTNFLFWGVFGTKRPQNEVEMRFQFVLRQIKPWYIISNFLNRATTV